MAKQESEKLPYFLPHDVVQRHLEEPEKCWLTCLGSVYELSEYIALNPKGLIGEYLKAHASKDISHWFDTQSRHCGCKVELRRYVDLVTGRRQIVLPYNNPVPDTVHSKSVPISGDCECSCQKGIVAPCQADKNDKSSEMKLTGKCWSELEHVIGNNKYRKGWLTKKARPCSITNVLTGQRVYISVCEEDSLERIRERALMFNRHGTSYTCKFEGKLLDTSLTLTENGIPDERERYLACGLPDDKTTYIPNLLWYFNDDLTEF